MPNPLTTWNPVVTRGLAWTRMIALRNADGEPITQFASKEWRLSFYRIGGVLIYQTVAGDWTEVSASSRMVSLDEATTALFPAGNFTYDLDVLDVTNGRLVSDGRGIGQEDG